MRIHECIILALWFLTALSTWAVDDAAELPPKVLVSMCHRSRLVPLRHLPPRPTRSVGATGCRRPTRKWPGKAMLWERGIQGWMLRSST
jgi:hypothetical protein